MSLWGGLDGVLGEHLTQLWSNSNPPQANGSIFPGSDEGLA